jgi:polyphosphate kinase
MNALVDPAIIALLYEASQAGVPIDLIVRGMCSLRPGLEGLSDNIRVISVIGRFLEHSRLFWFGNGGDDAIFIGSADWMPRNLDRRVEAVAPVEDPRLKIQLQKLMDLYLRDSRAWHMLSDGHYCQRLAEGEELLVQNTMMKRWRGGLTPPNSDT